MLVKARWVLFFCLSVIGAKPVWAGAAPAYVHARSAENHYVKPVPIPTREPVPDQTVSDNNDDTPRVVSRPLISVNTDSPLDINWSTALEFSDAPTELRPQPIVIPMLADYPIDNLEIRLNVLNVPF